MKNGIEKGDTERTGAGRQGDKRQVKKLLFFWCVAVAPWYMYIHVYVTTWYTFTCIIFAVSRFIVLGLEKRFLGIRAEIGGIRFGMHLASS